MRKPLHVVDLTALRGAGPFNYEIALSAADLDEIRETLGLLGLRKLRAKAQLTAQGKRDWQLSLDWGATVEQPCVVTLDPVTTRLDQIGRRLYLKDFEAPIEEEMEIPEDDTQEPLPAQLDLVAILTEMIALALPEYPRAGDAELDKAVFAEPGVTPMTDEDARPFAGLAALRDSLSKPDTQ